MSITVSNIHKAFGNFQALKDVSLEIPTGKLTSLLGPSGSGKTTLLRIIAGIEQAHSGTILLHDEDVGKQPVRDRQVGFVFQHYALFRHMSVFENVAFGLRVRPRSSRPPEAEIRKRVMDLLKLVQLDWLADRYPNQLSGGQRQRIALARALAIEPKVLLLDEPFGALDAQVRKELRRWLRKLHEEINITTVLVTHDQEEALEVSDQVVVMNQGRIEQVGTPDEVFEHPKTAFVMEFVGSVNLFHMRREIGQAKDDVAFVRPHEIAVHRISNGTDDIEASVFHVVKRGAIVRLELVRLDTQDTLDVELSREQFEVLGVKTGEHVFVRPRQERYFSDDYSI